MTPSGAEQPWFEHTTRVRYAETDQMGVVYHGNYLVYMEEGRTLMMESLGLPYAELERRGFGLVVRKAALRFRAPARYGETLRVRTRIERLGGASIAFEYTVLRDGEPTVLCEGSTELACVDLRKPERPVVMLPDEMRALFSV
jgi:acyl-CoA thioester hydrolase